MSATDRVRILIADDDPNVRRSLSLILENKGFSPVVVASGAEALAGIAQEPVSLALIDLRLEDMSGLELMQEIETQTPGTDYIVITGYASQATAIEAINLGAYSYVKKPYEVEQLLVTIRRALEKQQAERALRESEEKYSNLFRFSNDGIFLYDLDGRILDANQRVLDKFGYSRAELLAMAVPELHPPEVLEVSLSAFEQIAADGVVNFEITFRKKSGDVFPAEVSSSLFEFGGKRVIQGIVRDITGRKRLEEELLKVQKLESVGILAGGIAHDFNNILTAILGNIGLAKMHAELDTRLQQRLVKAEKACLRARDLTQQLLTFSKGGVPIRKIASVATLIEETAEFAVRGTNVYCMTLVPDDLWPVDIDEGQISQVINNLVLNAAQAMPEGGTVEVRAQGVSLDEGQVLALPAGRYVEVSIEDHGVGIPEKHLSKIFDPYFTTKQQGSGLGLATCYAIIKNHDGAVTVESELGAGTVFRFYLPASGEEVRPSQAVEAAIATGTGRVLVMDDEEVVREVAIQILGHLGFEAEAVSDGAEVIARYQESKAAGRPFDAVIMDLTVPGGLGGKEAVVRLLEIDPGAKAIVSSGYSNDPVMARFEEYGFSGVVSKPYTIKDLSETLRDVMA